MQAHAGEFCSDGFSFEKALGQEWVRHQEPTGGKAEFSSTLVWTV